LERSKPDRDISEFLLRACHDMRQSTRTVRTHSELLLKDAGQPRIPDLETRLGLIVDGAGRIDLLVDGLVRYSIALQTGDAPFQPVPMGPLLRSVLAKLDRELRDSGAEVTGSDLPRVSGNPDRLAELLEGLIRNALMHRADAAPRVRIHAVKREEDWQFTVQDNGPGVEAEYLERIFRPFERMHAKRRCGVGLGLAIAREIVERHGGRIWAESQPGAGASFHFTLPALEG
jgi:signal transduction histidine kinase